MNFFLKDRVKEISRSTGVGPFILDGASPGFDSFSNFYNDGDSFFYAITDGDDYEVGSGQFIINGPNNTLVRFPHQSSNSNNHVNFNAGVKEVFVTYPAKGAIYSADSHNKNRQPADSGVAFYASDQIVSYDDKLIWDSGKYALGIYQSSPTYAVDIGGDIDYSVVRASGFIDGGSGILFSGVLGTYSGGRQIEPFLRNITNNETGSDAVIQLSGLVNEGILLHKQIPRTFFAGPTDDCGCVSDYPTFRLIDVDDLPLASIDDRYVRQANVGLDVDSVNTATSAFRAGSLAIYSASGYITYDSGIFYDASANRLMINRSSSLHDPRAELDVDGDIYSTNIQVSGYLGVKGNINTSGIFSTEQGINIDSNVPVTTTNMLYNDGGNLYWNGASLVAPSYTFKATDGYQLGDSISDGETLTVSGVSGVAVRYAAGTNNFTVGAAELSGVLQGQIDDFSAGAFSFNITNGKFANDAILNTETITISGVSGVSAEYDPANNFFRIGASGLSGVLQSQLDEQLGYLSNEFGPVSLSGVSGVAFYASGWIDSFNPNINSIEATSGVAKNDGHYVLDRFGSGILKRLGMNDNLATIVGYSGGHKAQSYQEAVMLGTNAGRELGVARCSVVIGSTAGFAASGAENSVILGCQTGSGSYDFARSIAIGNDAMTKASGVGDSIFIGNRAGAAASGDFTSTTNHDIIAIGKRAYENAYFCSDGNIAIGNLSSRFSEHCSSGVNLGASTNVYGSYNFRSLNVGNSAGNRSSYGYDSINMGASAGYLSQNINASVFIGQNAGWRASGSADATRSDVDPYNNAVLIGTSAGYDSKDCSEMVAIGRQAGTHAERSVNSIYIGTVAGSGRHDRTGDIIFSNTSTRPAIYNPTFGTGNGKNGAGWTLASDDILEISTAVQGYINNLEDDDNRDVKIHIGHPLASSSQLKATIQPQRTSPADYHIYLENSGTAPSNTEQEVDMAMADSPLKDTGAGEDGIPFVGPSGFMRVPWCVRTGGDELLYNGTQVPHIDGTIVGWMDSDVAPTNFGWAIGFFKGLPPMLGVSDGWVFHTGVKP